MIELSKPVPSSATRAISGLRRYWPALLIWSVVALLPAARLAGIPIAVMLVLGLVAMLRRPQRLRRSPALRFYLTLFACFWIPAVLAAFDAVAPAKSWGSVLAYLRFVPVGWFVLEALDDPKQRLALWRLTAALVLFWCLDALFQAVTGFNFFGMAHSSDRLNGIFGQSNLKLGPVLAVLSPLPLEYARRFLPRAGFLAVLALLLSVIVLVGTRSAWIMFALVTLGYAYLYARSRPRRWIKAGLVVGGAALLIGAAGYQLSPTLAGRVDRSLLVLEGDAASVDQALGWRLPIWTTAWRMIADNPLTGVGVRGFRHAYERYADPGDPWISGAAGSDGAFHAHQLLFELLTETGLFGLAGFALAVLLTWRHWSAIGLSARTAALPLVLALGVMIFPLNTHLAFYSTFWSLLCWWLVMLYCAFAGGARGR